MKRIGSIFTVKKILLFLVIGGVFGSIAYFKVRSAEPTYKTTLPENRDLASTLEISGYIDAKERADLHFPAAGQMTWIGVKEGDSVKKWQTIASLDSRTLQKQLQQRLNLFGKAYRSHEQVLDDNNMDSDPQVDKELRRILDSAQLDLNNSVLDVEIADLSVKLSRLSSPINGIVTHLDVPNAGTVVGPTDMFQVVNPETIYFAAVVDEVDIGKIQPGQAVSLEFDAYPGQSIPTTIESVDFAPTTSRTGGTGYKVHMPLDVDNASQLYKLGMNGTAAVTLAEKGQVMTVPTEALQYKEDRIVVEVLEGKTVVEKPVTIGMETDEYVEILDGLNPTDQVVISEKG